MREGNGHKNFNVARLKTGLKWQEGSAISAIGLSDALAQISSYSYEGRGTYEL